MNLAFILPAEAQRRRIDAAQEQILEMRPDQIRHLEHLLRSWGIFGRGTDRAVSLTWKAIKRTLRDRP